jgi:thiol-disulfide isomerase/thioredoxin
MWMVTVRKVFGLVLIGMALYFLMPLMGTDTTLIFVEFFALAAVYLLFFEAGRTKQKQFAWALRVIGVAAFAVAVWMAWPRQPEPTIVWQPYSEQALVAAKSEGKGVIIDAYADWCIPCKELDKFTFTDADVRREAERFVMLKLDLTKDDPATDAGRAKQRFAIQGVPTVVFLDGAGRELKGLRLAGFESAGDFLARMKKVEPGAAGEALAQNLGPENGEVSDAPPAQVLPAGATTPAAQPEATATEKEVAATAPAPVGAAPDATTKPAVTLGKEINEPLPAASLSLLAGGALDLASLRGKVVVLSFWATWCVPCIQEIPIFNQLARAYKSQGLELIAVAYPDEGADVVKSFLKQHRMSYTQALGSESDAARFRVSDDRPDVLIIDKQGRIRFRHDRLTKKEVLEAEITKLLGE